MNLETILQSISDPSQRKFGVEIEVNGINRQTAAQALTERGIAARAEDYNHSTRNWWKVVTDASLSGGRDHSCEVVSPPLPFNKESLQLVASVLQALRGAGATVDNSCGLHVHVDARDMTQEMPDFSRVLFLRYRECEEQIDQLVAANRRADNNRSHIATLKSMSRTADFRYLRTNRYIKLNFQSFERHGTIEFRQHEGCLKETKVVAWIIFCVNFFEQCKVYFQDKGLTEVVTAGQWL